MTISGFQSHGEETTGDVKHRDAEPQNPQGFTQTAPLISVPHCWADINISLSLFPA